MCVFCARTCALNMSSLIGHAFTAARTISISSPLSTAVASKPPDAANAAMDEPLAPVDEPVDEALDDVDGEEPLSHPHQPPAFFLFVAPEKNNEQCMILWVHAQKATRL